MLDLEFELAINNENGESIAFIDTTVNYETGGNIGYSDVKAVRFLFQNYLKTSTAETIPAGDELLQYNRYIKTQGGSTVYDNKTQVAGSIYIPFVNLTVNSGDAWETLGIYSPLVTSYLPTSLKSPFITTTSDWGIDQPVFPGTIYGLQYEIYKDTSPTTLTNVTNESQYIVSGAGTCLYNGNTYRQGEAFVATDNGSVSFTGSANLKILEASRQKFYVFTWELKKRFYEIVSNNCECDISTYYNIQTEFDSLEWVNLFQRVSEKRCQQTINWINEKLIQIENA